MQLIQYDGYSTVHSSIHTYIYHAWLYTILSFVCWNHAMHFALFHIARCCSPLQLSQNTTYYRFSWKTASFVTTFTYKWEQFTRTLTHSQCILSIWIILLQKLPMWPSFTPSFHHVCDSIVCIFLFPSTQHDNKKNKPERIKDYFNEIIFKHIHHFNFRFRSIYVYSVCFYSWPSLKLQQYAKTYS